MMESNKYGYETEAASQVERGAIGSAENALNLAVDLSERVEAMVNRLCGAAPAQGVGNVEKLSSLGIFPSLKGNAERCSNQIYSAMRALDRLERQIA